MARHTQIGILADTSTSHTNSFQTPIRMPIGVSRVFLHAHGTEEGSNNHEGHQRTYGYTQTFHEGLVKWACLGAEMYKAMEGSDTWEAGVGDFWR